jgi:hypothetical protein
MDEFGSPKMGGKRASVFRVLISGFVTPLFSQGDGWCLYWSRVFVGGEAVRGRPAFVASSGGRRSKAADR